MNIIGISGFINSGKDTAAQMIQYLTVKDMMEKGKKTNGNPFVELKPFEEWRESYLHYVEGRANSHVGPYGPWEIKKFAEKLKQIVSLLTGIPRADLEKQEVKDSYLGPEWDRVIHSFPPGDSYSLLEGEYVDKSQEDLKLPYIAHWLIKREMTVRWLLQTLGTDAMRDVIHPNIHVNALFADYKMGPHTGITRDLIYPNWIISDVRFPNEAQAIKDRGGIVIRVERPLKSELEIVKHSSETALNAWNFDEFLHNRGSLENLLIEVKDLCKKHKIIS